MVENATRKMERKLLDGMDKKVLLPFLHWLLLQLKANGLLKVSTFLCIAVVHLDAYPL